MDLAVKVYQAELDKLTPGPKKALCRVCTEVSVEWKIKTGHDIKLCHATPANLAKGGIRLSTFNANKGWLLDEEVDIVIEYATNMAACGFPLTHKLLKEHVDKICTAQLGNTFPEEGVGKK